VSPCYLYEILFETALKCSAADMATILKYKFAIFYQIHFFVSKYDVFLFNKYLESELKEELHHRQF